MRSSAWPAQQKLSGALQRTAGADPESALFSPALPNRGRGARAKNWINNGGSMASRSLTMRTSLTVIMLSSTGSIEVDGGDDLMAEIDLQTAIG